MSRRRTTKKLYRTGVPVDTKAGSGEAVVDDRTPPDATQVDDGAPLETQAAVSAETLDRMLAAEAAEREVGEQRTADLVGRYFKLTLAMVCLNMVVAGANVAMLFRHPREVRTVVTTTAPALARLPEPAAPPTPALAQPALPDPQQAPAGPVAQPLLGPAKPSLLGAATPLPGGKPLLGKAAPARKARANKSLLRGKPDADGLTNSPGPEPTRALANPARSGSVLTAKLVDERDSEGSRLAERW